MSLVPCHWAKHEHCRNRRQLMTTTPHDQSVPNPALTVLMPVYNAKAYIHQAIDSVLAQSFTHYQLLLLDDGSTDGSWEILQQYARQDPRVIAKQFEHQGHAALMNKGMAMAQTQLVAGMHADDIALPDRFEKQVAYLNAHPNIQVLGTSYQILAGDKQTKTVLRNPTDPKAVSKLMAKGCCVGHPTIMFRKQALIKAGGYRHAFLPAEDHELWLRMLANEPDIIANLPETLLWYRIHQNQASTSRMQKTMLCSEAAIINYKLLQQGKPAVFDDTTEIDYEQIAIHMPPAALNRRLITGYCVRLVQFEIWGMSTDEAQAVMQQMLSFAKTHGLEHYAHARLAAAMLQNKVPGKFTLPHILKTLWLAARSFTFQKEVIVRILGLC